MLATATGTAYNCHNCDPGLPSGVYVAGNKTVCRSNQARAWQEFCISGALHAEPEALWCHARWSLLDKNTFELCPLALALFHARSDTSRSETSEQYEFRTSENFCAHVAILMQLPLATHATVHNNRTLYERCGAPLTQCFKNQNASNSDAQQHIA
eukprot:6203978-Pleurochrysis_carterae.AAC.2